VERVRAAGLKVWESPNGVVLARRVPATAIVALDALTRRAETQKARLRALFGLG
jgi:putative RNA 2'-phosphotransferase